MLNLSKNHKSSIINHKFSSGFTLVELLVVITIISILAALLMTNFVGIRQRGRDAQRKSDLRQIQAALELYRSDNGYYPTSLYSVSCPTSGTFTANSVTYMQKVPCDPLSPNGNYTYTAAPSLCDNTPGNTCSTYTIVACIETVADRDAVTNSNCTATTNLSLTFNNP